MVRTLIATAALLMSSSNASAYASAGALPPRPIAVVAAPFGHVSVAEPASVALPLDATPAASSEDALKTYTVVRYDTLWGLAEQPLGNPLRWREAYYSKLGLSQPD